MFADEVAFFLVSDGGEHFHFVVEGGVDSRLADASRSRVNQNALARFDVADLFHKRFLSQNKTTKKLMQKSTHLL